MRKSVKKILAGLLVGAMALCATAPAFAADKTDATGTYKASFYAYYDADKDGTSEWAPAPMGMDTGCITSGWIYNQAANMAIVGMNSFSVGTLTGAITDVAGSAVIGTTTDADGYVTQAIFNTSALTTVPGTNVQGVPAALSYSVLGTGMSNGMDVYLVIENV